MNLLKGFRVRSEKSRQTTPMEMLDSFASTESGFTGELTLEELLADPVARSMMARDQVDPADIVGMFRLHEQQAA